MKLYEKEFFGIHDFHVHCNQDSADKSLITKITYGIYGLMT